MTNPYFDELAERLRARGLPEGEVTRTVDDLAAFVAEAGTDPVQEFGTPEEFALQVAPADGPGADGKPSTVPSDSVETWTWRADAFHERDMLARYGDEGWEVDRVDRTGRFVSHRDPENSQRWQYHRETVLSADRQAIVDRLAPDGWEPCGTWFCYEYFKRPKAATLGPEAELHDVPQTPAGRTFLSRRFYVFMVAYGAFIFALVVLASVAWAGLSTENAGTVLLATIFTGLVAGALVGAGMAYARTRAHRRGKAS
ncbi:hypothetical protein E1293_40600 [Actinomadura darangshiensis]|uniref:DUF2812 domain-containing protein n=1 Tax=Actinomadura darangshiensis TaxID=705336 RepID=A0A4V2YR93_9ACTN|nr:hypothetical protein [Actinomadura darangshiensis]TDD65177.1 hypothetical protein E1293_40600 [Actinomadura darangshiensis]